MGSKKKVMSAEERDRLRKVELKVIQYQVELEGHGYDKEYIEEKTAAKRRKLMSDMEAEVDMMREEQREKDKYRESSRRSRSRSRSRTSRRSRSRSRRKEKDSSKDKE